MLYDLVGFTGSGLAHATGGRFDENVPERAARLIAREARWAPAIIVFPDCFTALGGNQYVNSSAIGRYADYLTREIIPFVDREFRTLASREHRGCFGKSSGGYGAIIHGMKYPQHWGAVADHSGDAYFDFVYWHDWPNTLDELAKYRRAAAQAPAAYDALRRRRRRGSPTGCDDGRVARFLEARVEQGEALDGGGARDHESLHGRDLRSRSARAERLPRCRSTSRPASCCRERWRRWLRARPDQPGRDATAQDLQVAARHLHRLRLARPVPHPLRQRASCRKRLAEHGVAHRYEEFDDTHSDIDYRMDVRCRSSTAPFAEASVFA